MSLAFTSTDPLASYAGAPFSTIPATISALVKRTTVGVTGLILELSDGTANNYIRMQGQSTNLFRGVVQAAGAGVQNADTGTTWTDNTKWYLVAIRCLNATTRAAVIESVLTTSGNVASRTPTGLNTLRFGTALDGTLDFVGRIAHVAFWDTNLADADLTALYNDQGNTGVYANAAGIVRGNLQAYYPMTDPTNPGLDAIGTRHLTIGANCAYNSDDPPVFLAQWARGSNSLVQTLR